MDALERLKAKPVSQKAQLAKQMSKEFFKNSLYHTSKYLLDYKDINWRTHGKVIETLEDPSLRKLLVLPRGTFKSSLACEALPIFLLNNNPDLRILLDSEVYTNSKNFLRKIRALLEMPKIVDIFGVYKNPENWNEGEITIAQRTKAFKEASVTCSGIGAVKVGQHYDVIIFDDMNSPNNSSTPEGRQKVIDHYKMSIGLLEPGGTIVVIGTRYAEDDLPGWILENEINVGKGLL